MDLRAMIPSGDEDRTSSQKGNQQQTYDEAWIMMYQFSYLATIMLSPKKPQTLALLTSNSIFN